MNEYTLVGNTIKMPNCTKKCFGRTMKVSGGHRKCFGITFEKKGRPAWYIGGTMKAF